MAMLVVLLDLRGGAATLDVATANQLAGLGVTQVTVARDQTTEAVVLEGWAFDVAACGAEAGQLVGGGHSARSLHPVLQTLITAEHGPAGELTDHGQTPTPRTPSSSSAKG
jgi:hypothetical protein